MRYMEQILYGQHPLRPSVGNSELARSTGLSPAVVAEVCACCDAWGELPALGLKRPVFLSLPLGATMPAMRGQLYTVIRVVGETAPLFHAAVLNDAIYQEFGRNPFAFNIGFQFIDEWGGDEDLSRVEVAAAELGELLSMTPSADDVGIVDEAVLQLMSNGSLELPLQYSTADSDRLLALIIACLPLRLRRGLRFSSLTTSLSHGYGLAGVETENAECSGWRRLMLSQIEMGLTPALQDYQAALVECLTGRDLAGIGRVSTRAKSSVVETRSVKQTPAPPQVVRKPLVATVRPPVVAPVVRPAIAPRSPQNVRVTSRPAVTLTHGRRGVGHGFGRTLLALAVMGFIAWWQQHSARQPIRSEGGVVQVGTIYEGVLKHMGGHGLSLYPAGDRGQQRALREMHVAALDPLLVQARHFIAVTAAGIQANSRPDRERERLLVLRERGDHLAAEMTRLELAWFSLTTGANWLDVGSLPDAGVRARWDSLAASDRGARGDMQVSMGTDEVWRSIVAAQRQAEGMASVLALLSAAHWSRSWERNLAAAADRLVPEASPATRSYRNSAFLLTRLKRAEHQCLGRAQLDTLDVYPWRLPTVNAILARLQREEDLFPEHNAPTLVRSTVGFYVGLQAAVASQDTTNAIWKGLHKNSALRFDSALYEAIIAHSMALGADRTTIGAGH